MQNQIKMPVLMVDIVIFTVIDAVLKVLLIRRGVPPFQNMWALPGGRLCLDQDATLEAAARRELAEETGINHQQLYLEQLYTYGSATRDPRGWTVTVAYFALIAAENLQLQAGTDAAEAKWQSIDGDKVSLALAFDHADILQDAIRRLRSKLGYTDIAVHLLPKEFTLSELQRIYEIIMQEKLNKSSFRLRVEKAEIVKPIAGKMRMGSNRPAQLYEFIESREDRMFYPRSIAWAERKRE